MFVIEYIFIVLLSLPLLLQFTSMCLDLIVDTIKDIIENIKGDYK